MKAHDKNYATRHLETVQKIDEHIEKEGLDEYLKRPDSYYNEFYNDYVKNIIRSIIPDIPKVRVQKILYTDERKENVEIIEEDVSYDEKEIFDMYYILCNVYGVVIEDPDILKTIITTIILSDKPLGVMMKEYKILIDTLERKNKNITFEEEAHEEWKEMIETPVDRNDILATPLPNNRSFTSKFNPQTPVEIKVNNGGDLLKKSGALQTGQYPLAQMATGGRRKTTRHKKRHTKHHSSKTRRTKPRKTYKK